MSRNLLQSLDYSVLQQCMHCGMCLPACPTYVQTGIERHSPRGRISLMRAIADGELEPSRTFGDEMYDCLGCLACTSACPAGVNYAELFETARAEVERSGALRSPQRNFWRWFAVRFLFTRPRLLRTVGRFLWLWQISRLDRLARSLRLTLLLPRRLRELEPTTPRMKSQFSDDLIARVERPKQRPARHRVALLTGCVQDLAFSDVNRATADVLLENDCEIHTPRAQPCCGSLHAHNGDLESARQLARRQLDSIDPFGFDAIISNAGGCGSHLRHYGQLLADDPAYAARAAEWSRKVRDISEWLVQIDFRHPLPPADAQLRTVTYHESCHLRHGQQVSAQPQAILRAIPGLEFHPCGESAWCCGSAGIYNITRPETARWLQERKIGHIRRTGASIVATGNPGCHLQVQGGLREAGATGVTVEHPVVLLARAYHAETDMEHGRSTPSR